MDWIEQLLGFSPDGGDGTTEVMIVFVACVVVALVIYNRVPRIRNYVRSFLGWKVRT
jgi:hypothetical protein